VTSTLEWEGGGGACQSTLYNCIAYYNTATNAPNYLESSFQYSCTTPRPEGLGNIETEPGFVDLAGGIFYLLPDSPCIDAGTDLSGYITADLLGNLRPMDGNGDGILAFDMGAFEYPSTGCFMFRQAEYFVVEREIQAIVEVIRSGPGGLGRTVTVDYVVRGGTATAGADYVAVSGTLTFSPGVTNQLILIPLLNDGLREPEETILLKLSNAAGGVVLGGRTTTIRIQDNDPGVAFAAGEVTVLENHPNTTLSVRRGDDIGAAFAVDYAVSGGTATAGADFTAVWGTLEFADGETEKQIVVSLLNDALREEEEAILLTLNNPTRGASLGSPITASIRIEDNDSGVALATNEISVLENQRSITVTVRRGDDFGSPFTVGYATAEVSADPSLWGGYDPPRPVHGVVVEGHYAYLANDWDGLLILDVADPSRPIPVGTYPTSGNASGIKVVGGYAYVANTAEPPTVERVIEISVDGLRGDLLEQLIANDPGRYPNFLRLKTESAFTFNARTDCNYTETTPNHVTIVTGRPVLQPLGWPPTLHHGVSDNSANPAIIHVYNPALGYVPGVFDAVHDYGLSTAIYVSKTKLSIFDRSYNEITGAPDLIGVDNGRDKIDTAYTLTSTPAIVNALVQEVPRHFTFIHMVELDTAGHNSGWGSETWKDALAGLDANLGIIFSLIDQNPAYQGNTAILLTADHGGGTGGHGNSSAPGNYTIPFFVWGPGMPSGSDLYDLFSNRFNPGPYWLDYTAAQQPLRNGDISNVALSLLGLDPIPGSPLVPARTAPRSSQTNDLPAIAVIDVRDPAHPTEVCGFAAGNAAGIDVERSLAYVAQGLEGLQVFDVSDPAHPVLVNSYDMAGYAYSLDVAGPLICVADRTGSLVVLGRSSQASQDFAVASGTLEFAAGETEKPIVIPLVHDQEWEPEELFLLTLSNPTGGVSLGSPTTAAIRIIEASLEILGWPEGGQLRLRLCGPSGWTCEIEQSLDLVQWQKVAEARSTGSPQDVMVPVPPGQTVGFYRAVMR
jgi:hypothetical protein